MKKTRLATFFFYATVIVSVLLAVFLGMQVSNPAILIIASLGGALVLLLGWWAIDPLTPKKYQQLSSVSLKPLPSTGPKLPLLVSSRDLVILPTPEEEQATFDKIAKDHHDMKPEFSEDNLVKALVDLILTSPAYPSKSLLPYDDKKLIRSSTMDGELQCSPDWQEHLTPLRKICVELQNRLWNLLISYSPEQTLEVFPTLTAFRLENTGTISYTYFETTFSEENPQQITIYCCHRREQRPITVEYDPPRPIKKFAEADFQTSLPNKPQPITLRIGLQVKKLDNTLTIENSTYSFLEGGIQNVKVIDPEVNESLDVTPADLLLNHYRHGTFQNAIEALQQSRGNPELDVHRPQASPKQ